MGKCKDSINSSCVVWDGPDIECLGLCKGETVTDVVYKLGKLLCTLLEQLKIDVLDFKCYVNENPKPENIQELLQWFIDKLCEIKETPPPPPNITCELVQSSIYTCPISFILCDSNGQPSNYTLPLWHPTQDSFVSLVSAIICVIRNDISQIKNDITNILSQITYILNNCCNDGGGGGFSLDITPNTCVYFPGYPPPETITTNEQLETYLFFIASTVCCIKSLLGYDTDARPLLECNVDDVSLSVENDFSIIARFCSSSPYTDFTVSVGTFAIQTYPDLVNVTGQILNALYGSNGVFPILEAVTNSLQICFQELTDTIALCNCICTSIHPPHATLIPMSDIPGGYNNSANQANYFIKGTYYNSTSLPFVSVDLNFSMFDTANNTSYPATTIPNVSGTLISSGHINVINYPSQNPFTSAYTASNVGDDVYINMLMDVKYRPTSGDGPATCIRSTSVTVKDEWYRCGYVVDLFAYTT